MLKKCLKKIDHYLFDEYIQNIVFKIKYSVLEKRIRKNYQFRQVCFYSKSGGNQVAELCDLYGSDKGSRKSTSYSYSWSPHTYTDVYSDLFDHCRNHVYNVFECGLGTNKTNLNSSMGINGKPGASLRVWKDYFPNAIIFGADIDKDILFSEDRIKTYYLDQRDKTSIISMLSEIGQVKFDLIIDDGLHTFKAGCTLFENTINTLSQSGIYTIEDVTISDMERYQKYFLNSRLKVEFISLHRAKGRLNDNNIIIIRNTPINTGDSNNGN